MVYVAGARDGTAAPGTVTGEAAGFHQGNQKEAYQLERLQVNDGS